MPLRRFLRFGAPRGQAKSAAPGPPSALARADAARDAKRFAEAAELYAVAARAAPHRPGILVQRGNMLKDGGRPREALESYRQALALAPDNADTWLQVARAEWILGRAKPALAACDRALELDPRNEDAKDFLIQRGRAALQADRVREIESGARAEPLLALAEQVERLTAGLDRLRAELPSRAQFSFTPHEGYDGYRRRFAPPAPPETAGPIRVIYDGRGAGLPAYRRFRASLEGQTLDDWRLFVEPGGDPGVAAMVDADPRAALAAGRPPAASPVALAAGAVTLTPDALAWLAFAARRRPQALIVADEVVVRAAGEAGETHLPPDLTGAPDFDRIAAQGRYPGVICAAAGRAAALDPAADWRRAFLEAARDGSAAHLALPLLHRAAAPEADPGHAERLAALLGDRAEAAAGDRAERPFHLRWRPTAPRTVSVIVPTRNNGPMAESFAHSLLDRAGDAGRVDLTIIDNGSDDPETMAALRRLDKAERVSVIRVDAPFNWSRLNNDAAAQAAGDILVFANDDMLMLSEGWDAELDGLLSRPEIGLVGAMLFYPDGGIQHAGMIAGWRGGFIHEGLGHDEDAPGPGARWLTPRRAAAVTGAFMAMRAETFRALGGFDQTLLPVSNSDVDMALRARAAGLETLWTPDIRLTHHESLTRGQERADPTAFALRQEENRVMRERWGAALDADPFTHPAWAEFGRPMQHLRPLTLARVLNHLDLTAAPTHPGAIPLTMEGRRRRSSEVGSTE